MAGKDASLRNFETSSDTSSNSSIRRGLKRAYDAVACRYSDPSVAKGDSLQQNRSSGESDGSDKETFKESNAPERTVSPDESSTVHSAVHHGPCVPFSLTPFVTQQHLSDIASPATLIGASIMVPTRGTSKDIGSLSCQPLGLGLPSSSGQRNVLSEDDAEAQLKQKHLLQQQMLIKQQHLERHQLRYLFFNRSLPSQHAGPLTLPVAASQFLPNTPVARVSNGSQQPSETKSNCIQPGAKFEGKTLPMYVPTDDKVLSEYNILLRKNLEYFEAGQEEVESVVPGRKKKLVLGQVGIRCRFCKTLPVRHQPAGTVYFPTKTHRLYHSAQRIATAHFFKSCSLIDPELRTRLTSLQNDRSKTSTCAGKEYWSNSAKALGLLDTCDGLRFGKQT